MSLEAFDAIYNRAAERKGGESKLESLLSKPLNSNQLKKLGDDRFLAEFTKKVFQSGFVWRVVEQKWPDFEEVFFQFDIEKILLLSDEMLEKKATNPAIIRNLNKVLTVRENALMMKDVQDKGSSFAEFVADWPSDNIIGLWDYLKKQGSRLGGNTGPYGLRAIGKDTFLISRDVEGYFKAAQIISGSATSKRSLNAMQDSFNEWQVQSKRSLQELSRILSMSVGDNHIQAEG